MKPTTTVTVTTETETVTTLTYADLRKLLHVDNGFHDGKLELVDSNYGWASHSADYPVIRITKLTTTVETTDDEE